MGRRGTGSVRIKDGRIEIRYTPYRGAKSQRSFSAEELRPTQANLAHVKANVEEYIRQHLFQTQGGRGDFFSDCDSFLNHADLTRSTIETYEGCLNKYWVPYLGREDTLRITYAQLEDIDRQTEWTSPKRRQNAINAIRGVFKMVYKQNQLPFRTSPAHSLEVGRMPSPEPDPYTREERGLIIEHGGMYEWLAFGTGMRTGEIIAARWENYDGDRIWVNDSTVRGESRGTTKTHRSRPVVVPSWLRSKLASYPTRFKQSTILLTQYGKPYTRGNKLNDLHVRVLRSAGVPGRRPPYPWRHTYATLSLMDGVSPEFIAAQLGHSVATLRKHYGRWMPGEYDNQEMEKQKW